MLCKDSWSQGTLLSLLQGSEVDLTASYKLSADLDLSGLEETWEPIGQRGTDGFSGTFDGGGHAITGLTLTNSDIGQGDYTALFGVINEGAVVSNVSVDVVFNDPQPSRSNKGAIAGESFGTIDGVFATGFIRGEDAIGGLVAHNYGVIVRSYARVDIEAGGRFGGLAGVNRNGGTIAESYAAGTLAYKTGGDLPNTAGGLIGVAYSGSAAERSFLDSDLAGTDKAVGDDGSGGGVGETDVIGLATDDAQSEEVIAGAPLNFDLDDVRAIDPEVNDGYPYLQANPP